MLYAHRQDYLRQAVASGAFGNGLLLLLVIMDGWAEAQRAGRPYNPGQEQLGERVNCSREAVGRWLWFLEKLGFIRRSKNARWVAGVVHRMADTITFTMELSGKAVERVGGFVRRPVDGVVSMHRKALKALKSAVCDTLEQQSRKKVYPERFSPSEAAKSAFLERWGVSAEVFDALPDRK